ncbi:amidohydrolase family protein [Paracoccus sp. R12_1]|uniref:metal-dependent hydrolase family protein n=1 Tax=unclassified Paracoccus (in: a-proteobacteria) TaxID=2688777 RepID=UPI001ADD41FE|nr:MULTISPECIES: amidohydrolase family protein [unclassified Paracoccus (in: a-proteobacteria)]MBO9455076.1 amidohydrolase family protein [Paracoccus sp. R12_2]MBO9485236.1 amidohydrolase family protein [Paracoccus sp. R12_1]
MCQACFEAAFQPGTLSYCHCGRPETQMAMRRIEADISRRQMLGGMSAVVGMFAGFGLAPRELRAQTPGKPLLLTNLKFFDGQTLSMRDGMDILIEGGRISGLPAVGQGPEDADRIDCGGRSVIPGLIDAHWHASLASVSQIVAMTQDIGLVHLLAGREAGATLQRGFTTVRDVGGPVFGLKAAIDRSVVEGPRIFPSGAMLSQTSGHGDFRFPNQLPLMPSDPPDYALQQGMTAITDGVPEILRRAREQLMKGASQIKIMAGGGVASPSDPIDSTQYLEEEMRAAVQAAEDWNTYVCAHVYTSKGIQRCIRAGVKSIEHGQLADQETVAMMADNDVWWSIQPFLADEDSNQYTDPAAIAAQKMVAEGTMRAFDLARTHKVNWAFGSDVLFGGAEKQGRHLSKLARFMSPLEALHRATGAAGQLLALSGPRAPYDGRLGVIEPGAFADLLVIDGDPSADLDWLEDTDNLRLIVKNGRVHKNSI